jgi:hypothetical protein
MGRGYKRAVILPATEYDSISFANLTQIEDVGGEKDD